jgi:hypothetical protein
MALVRKGYLPKPILTEGKIQELNITPSVFTIYQRLGFVT